MQAPSPKKTNSILADEEAIEAQDKFFDRLSHLAYAVPSDKKKQPVVEPASKYKSKFFHHVDEQNEIEVLEDISTTEKSLPDANSTIAKRSDEYAKELPKYIQDDLSKTRELFLTALAPKAFALQTGLNQAIKIIEEQVNEIDTSTLSFCQRACSEALKLKVIRFIQEYMQLSNEDTETLTELLLKKQVVNMFNINDEKRR